MMKKLIVYYSRGGENYFSGETRYIEVGNTEQVARMLQADTGADMFKVEQKVPYDEAYYTCIEEAKADLRQKARPELVSVPESLDAYDEIYLGYPIYWGDMPMAMYTFLEQFDWNGKTIHPFCTHEGSGLGRTEQRIRETCQGAQVSHGLAVHGDNIGSAKEMVRSWAARQTA